MSALRSPQPWLQSAAFDSGFILAPPLLAVTVAALLPVELRALEAVPLGWWLVLVLGIDVAHVYASIYRTYLVPAARRLHAGLLVGVPLGCWLAGILAYSVSPAAFWTVLAYVAVFHFVRQQYGFLRLYSRHEAMPRWRHAIEAATIYLATLYPLMVWHVEGRPFVWFTAGDFIDLSELAWLAPLVGIIYALVLGGYAFVQAREAHTTGRVNVPKQLVVLGTALAWYVGIVVLQGDLTFTLTNVVAHGLPYLGLVWLVSRREHTQAAAPLPLWLRSAPLFVLLLLALAFAEEWGWDVLVWHERGAVFGAPLAAEAWWAVLVPTLALPQFTHYVLDAFIWRRGFSPFTDATDAR